ncbi:hypothetical protein [Nocardiopsis ansamitocini]|uniref:hypothetical protein n=1 Tax=Nocardiopsis ansamitocini TaxID=1670832 RepID=UPI0025536BBB|nr:hypothetical protein [Nocardiopsis ansamitocini]
MLEEPDRLGILAALVADASSHGRRRALVEYEFALLAVRYTNLGRPPGTGWRRLLFTTLDEMAVEPWAAQRAADEVEGIRFRALTGSERLTAYDVRARIKQILDPQGRRR